MNAEPIAGTQQAPWPLSSVITTDLLAQRATRAPDLASENRVLLELAQAMADSPQRVLSRLVEHAMTLCRADSAGISLLESQANDPGKPHFRWAATAGGLESFQDNTMPRDFSPCGAVLDANRLLLMSYPVRHFTYMEFLRVPVTEVLLVPFHREGVAIGTVWVASHSADREFDSEDARLVTSLSRFAAAAVQVIESAETKLKREAAARARAEQELTAAIAKHATITEANREKSESLATLAHEFRNFLGPARTALRIIKLSPGRAYREEAREIVERQVRNLTRLVEDLTDTSSISSGGLRLQVEVADLNQIVRDAVESASADMAASDQRVTLELAASRIPMRCDEVRLAQVFGNLLTNAAKYGRRGGQVRFAVVQAGHAALVSVKDEGIGIDQQWLPRIFELFAQVEPSSGRSSGGLGIGLALVRHLVELHGGSVEARSDGVGTGSEFIVRLPILEGPADTDAA